jgi:hypothetical protein
LRRSSERRKDQNVTIIGVVLVWGFALAALAVAGLMLWSGWLAFKEELLPGFKVSPPSPGSIALTLLGVALPIVVTAIFTLYLAIWLVQSGLAAL